MTIHVEPSALRELSRTFHTQAMDMDESLFALRQAAQRLEIAWYGGSASRELLAELERLQAAMREIVLQFDLDGLRLSRQADQWEASDQHWQRIYRETVQN